MPIEMFKGLKEIGGFKVIEMDKLKTDIPTMFREDGSMIYQTFEKTIRPFNFVYVRRDVSSIAFTLQKGKVSEVGVNGCNVDTLVEAALIVLRGYQKDDPCDETEHMIQDLEHSLQWSRLRKRERASMKK